ncbi:two-component sensor histidine kinase [Pseudomonas sp. AFG_SD02_1510_Pfu_092]|nr:HAMP domain-containing sensor histidine kinase [Pseudomonas sp. AFG_SD02_1510_Pfu_092]RCL27549.1 two-component sensor histidine kinase [Pseudomonas sp. AFG_SD02_1510_Pfu_092]
MRLSTFIVQQMERILQAWEDFARTVDLPRETLSASGLRNHASFILRAVARDMETSQTVQQQIDKSQGLAPVSASESAAEAHAVMRLMDGFSMDQMVSEYRALRSSVLRLWLAQETPIDQPERVAEIIRFNEAIDQALAESIASYGKAVETTRKMVLGVLGHDLRSPLTAITMGASLLTRNAQLGPREQALATQIYASVERANGLVNDLLDLARCNLSLGIPIQREPYELSALCNAIVKEIRLGHPQIEIRLEQPPLLQASVDPSRMAQVVSNLIINAIRHGDTRQPIQVRLATENDRAVIDIHNWGNPIPEDRKMYLFNPEARLARAGTAEDAKPQGLGLGLFIANEIVTSHGGTIEVRSSTDLGTTFKVVFPLEPGPGTSPPRQGAAG